MLNEESCGPCYSADICYEDSLSAKIIMLLYAYYYRRVTLVASRYYGGWAAPNIYFLGFAGVIKFGNIRIGGLSGIYNARHYKLGWPVCMSLLTYAVNLLF